MIHDKMPRGVRNHVAASIRELEQVVEPVNDALDTLQHLARPLTVGLENEYRSLDKLLQEIRERWAFFEANGAWPSPGERLGGPRASASFPVVSDGARDSTELTTGEQSRESS